MYILHSIEIRKAIRLILRDKTSLSNLIILFQCLNYGQCFIFEIHQMQDRSLPFDGLMQYRFASY